MTPDYPTLERINFEINTQYPWVADPELHHAIDYWTDARLYGKGDCEDHSIAKSRTLQEIGWPIETLRYFFTLVEPYLMFDPVTGERRKAHPHERGHLTLLVTLNQGHWMLDNRHSLPIPAKHILKLGYQPISHQRIGGARKWVKFGGIET